MNPVITISGNGFFVPSAVYGESYMADMKSELIGKKLGKYLVKKLLGEGGLGFVFLAIDEFLERKVALKVVKPFLSSMPEIQKRFRKEAIAMARLGHPNIVQIYSLEQEADLIYFVMEHVPGKALDEVLKERGTFPLAEALQIITDAAGALAYAHRQGVLHRDIKTSNIMVTEEGAVKVLDFGLAAVASEATMITQPGEVLGTPSFMSPEQALGKTADHRSDIYSLGIVMFQLLSGQVPFTADSALSVLNQHVNTPLPPLKLPSGQVDMELERIIWKMTAKEPDDRYAKVASVAAAIKEYQTAPAQPVPTPVPQQRKTTSKPITQKLPPEVQKTRVMSHDTTVTRTPLPAKTPELLYDWAFKSVKEGMHSRALKYLDEMQEMGATTYAACKMRGEIYLKQGNSGAARTAFQEAAGFPESEAELLNNLGVMYQETNQHASAVAFLNLALKKKARFVNARVNLITSLIKQKDFMEALRHCNTVLQLEPGNTTAAYYRKQLRQIL